MTHSTRLLSSLAVCVLSLSSSFAAQLSPDAQASLPMDVQQLIVVDYRAMQNSPAAMSLKDRVLPPELKRLETAMKTSGLMINRDADVLAFAAFRVGDIMRTVGIAQGQFQTRAITARLVRNKIKPESLRNNSIYPMGGGNVVAFLNQTTMIFGEKDAVRAALDARDGMTRSFLSNSDLTPEILAVDSCAIWSLLGQKDTQEMMRSVLGDAAQLADYETVKNRFKSSRYTIDFQNGVAFEMAVVMSDMVTAATVATLMKGAVLFKKSMGSPMERSALDETTIDSNAGTLSVNYRSSDSQFASLLGSPLFQQVVR